VQSEQELLEMHRRQVMPTEREQVEDALHALVELVEETVNAEMEQQTAEVRGAFTCTETQHGAPCLKNDWYRQEKARLSKQLHSAFYRQEPRPLLRLPNRLRLLTDLGYREVSIFRKGEVTAASNKTRFQQHDAGAAEHRSRVFLRLFLAKAAPPYTEKGKRIKERPTNGETETNSSVTGDRLTLDHSARSIWEHSLLSDVAYALAVDISSVRIVAKDVMISSRSLSNVVGWRSLCS
jgi:hypothetical protein